jgi:carboxyl-terminal processing protease
MVAINQQAFRMPGRHAAALVTGLLGCAILLGACGGGGGGDGGSAGAEGSGGWTPGVFLPSSSFAAQCEAPRSGIDPETGQPYPDVQGTVVDENNFLRSYSDETYLWYAEIVDQNPANFNDPIAYFDELKTNAATPSGAPKDQFHFTVPTDEWVQLSQSGVSAGYGAAWVVLAPSPPREIVVAYTEPGSPATEPGVDLARGARIVAVDGVPVLDGSADALNAGLFPADAGETHTFTVEDLNSGGTTRDIQMTSENVVSTPVQNVRIVGTPMGDVGYLLFNDHIATAETELINAIEQLAGVDELVLDIRYNGGGFLAIASQLAYMVAGDVPTAGQTFEEMQFNDKHPSTNPVTGNPLQPMPFFNTTLGPPFPEPADQPLPTLSLPRVFVLTGPNTCSASESIMNGLAGVDIEVIQVGSTTCGKPYGFYPTDNCATTYFTIQFRGANAKDFGDYADGFMPVEGGGGTPAELPGCAVADDFAHALGDEAEARFAAALALIEGQACPPGTAPAAEGPAKARAPLSAVDGIMPKSPWRENRILRQDR